MTGSNGGVSSEPRYCHGTVIVVSTDCMIMMMMMNMHASIDSTLRFCIFEEEDPLTASLGFLPP